MTLEIPQLISNNVEWGGMIRRPLNPSSLITRYINCVTGCRSAVNRSHAGQSPSVSV